VTGLLAAELLKLKTVRATWGLLAATVFVSALAVWSAVVVADPNLNPESADGVRSILSVAANGAVFVLLLGIMISAGEYRHRTANDTYLTTPRRGRVIAAKLVSASATGVGFGALSGGAAMLAASLAYGADGFRFPIASSATWSAFAGVVLYGALFGAIGAATGSLVRNQVAATVGWLAWLFIVEHIAIGFLPEIREWLPAAAGLALLRGKTQDLPSALTGAAVLAAYAVVIMGAAIITERHRDA
jgi:ABC-2 type transport system permease protein